MVTIVCCIGRIQWPYGYQKENVEPFCDLGRHQLWPDDGLSTTERPATGTLRQQNQASPAVAIGSGGTIGSSRHAQEWTPARTANTAGLCFPVSGLRRAQAVVYRQKETRQRRVKLSTAATAPGSKYWQNHLVPWCGGNTTIRSAGPEYLLRQHSFEKSDPETTSGTALSCFAIGQQPHPKCVGSAAPASEQQQLQQQQGQSGVEP
ncbi:uncharacterized protein LOC129747415 [Uranotaenia lowii]|uniref:uncharacterized protein LOC129747415 n=1 Tax=Uranotaenia lowii TaxID=190385 RepID=UPI002478D5B5|nr:uncharacterized protein LOC129747415 [Uranotaenia lowii]